MRGVSAPDDGGAQRLVPRDDIVQRELHHRDVQRPVNAPSGRDDHPRTEDADLVAPVEGVQEFLGDRKRTADPSVTRARDLRFNGHVLSSIPAVAWGLYPAPSMTATARSI